jgi:dethiobiotin synthetase
MGPDSGKRLDPGLRAPAPVLLVTGTDTGVGKTIVAAGLARALAKGGRRIVAIKFVETGCGETIMPNEDGSILAEASGQREPAAALIRLRAPLAPALAADREDARIDFQGLLDRVVFYAREVDLAILEGAGGLYAPITWERNALDLARALDARVLVVGCDRLGVINHVLLTVRALENLRLFGIVLSAPAVPDASTGTNGAAIIAHAASLGIATGMRIAQLPRVATVDEAADHLSTLAGSLVQEADLA